MLFNFEINPSAMTAETAVAFIPAVIIFIVVPVVLAVAEYRITQKQKRNGVYLMLGTFASAVLLGAYSLLLGVLLLVIYRIASMRSIRNDTQMKKSI